MTDSVRIHPTSSQTKNETSTPQAQGAMHASPAARIGAVIARERRAAGITQDTLANHLDVTKAAVSTGDLAKRARHRAHSPHSRVLRHLL